MRELGAAHGHALAGERRRMEVDITAQLRSLRKGKRNDESLDQYNVMESTF